MPPDKHGYTWNVDAKWKLDVSGRRGTSGSGTVAVSASSNADAAATSIAPANVIAHDSAPFLDAIVIFQQESADGECCGA